MIELAPHTAVMTYLALIFSGLITVWVSHHFFQRKKPLIPARQQLITCEYCHMSFLKDSARPIAKCPQCSSLLKSSDQY